MTMREALDHAMGRTGDSDAVRQFAENGLAVADEDTMTQAIHDVYCGIMADHQHPNEKDRDQARHDRLDPEACRAQPQAWSLGPSAVGPQAGDDRRAARSGTAIARTVDPQRCATGA